MPFHMTELNAAWLWLVQHTFPLSSD